MYDQDIELREPVGGHVSMFMENLACMISVLIIYMYIVHVAPTPTSLHPGPAPDSLHTGCL